MLPSTSGPIIVFADASFNPEERKESDRTDWRMLRHFATLARFFFYKVYFAWKPESVLLSLLKLLDLRDQCNLTRSLEEIPLGSPYISLTNRLRDSKWIHFECLRQRSRSIAQRTTLLIS